MMSITFSDINSGLPIKQYYGKWPFVRVYGIQEIASTIFSILNALAHGYGIFYYIKSTRSLKTNRIMQRIKVDRMV